MDATPIYTELRKTLMDPEDTNWEPSAPPEFAAALTERVEQKGTSQPKKRSGSRGRSRRHRAED